MKKRAMKQTINTILCVILLLAAGCGGGGGGGNSGPAPFTVSGKTTIGGVAKSGVSITVVGGGVTKQQYSDRTGAYSINVAGNGAYTVTPTLHGYTFTPGSTAVTINNNAAAANFDALAVPIYTLSGKVSSVNSLGLAGVTVTATIPGAQPATAITDGGGNYAITGLTGGSYLVTPTRTDYYNNNLAGTAAVTFVALSQTVDVNGAVSVNSVVPGPNFAANIASYALSGQVLTKTGGQAMAGVTVTLTTKANLPNGGQPLTGADVIFTAVTGSDGIYVLPGVPTAYYQVALSIAGYDFALVQDGHLPSGADASDFRINDADLTLNFQGVLKTTGNGSASVTF